MNPKTINIGDKLVWLDPDNLHSQIVTVTFIDDEFIKVDDNEYCDSTVFDDELHTLDSILCCEKCGNIDIESRAWVFANSSIFNHNCDDLGHWCKNCGDIQLKTVKQYLDEKLETSVNG